MKWQSSIRRFSHIWLHPTRYEPKSFYILGYLLQPTIKIWRLGLFLPWKNCLSPPQNSKILQLKLIRMYPQVYNGGISPGQKWWRTILEIEISCGQMQRLSMHSTQSALIYFLLSFGVGWGVAGEDFFSFFLCSQHVSFPFPMCSHQTPNVFPMCSPKGVPNSASL